MESFQEISPLGWSLCPWKLTKCICIRGLIGGPGSVRFTGAFLCSLLFSFLNVQASVQMIVKAPKVETALAMVNCLNRYVIRFITLHTPRHYNWPPGKRERKKELKTQWQGWKNVWPWLFKTVKEINIHICTLQKIYLVWCFSGRLACYTHANTLSLSPAWL